MFTQQNFDFIEIYTLKEEKKKLIFNDGGPTILSQRCDGILVASLAIDKNDQEGDVVKIGKEGKWGEGFKEIGQGYKCVFHIFF